MSLKKQIEDKLNQALKAKDKNTYPTLRLIVSAIKDAEIAGRSKVHIGIEPPIRPGLGVLTVAPTDKKLCASRSPGIARGSSRDNARATDVEVAVEPVAVTVLRPGGQPPCPPAVEVT